MSEGNPVTKTELLASVGKSLHAVRRQREAAARLAAEIAAERERDQAQGSTQ